MKMLGYISIALLLAAAALAQVVPGGSGGSGTGSTITGTLLDLSGAPVTSGKVVFTLTPARDTTISGTARFSPQVINCLINASGNIVAQDGRSACVVTMNTALQPPGTYYAVGVWPYNVKTSTFTFYAVLSTYDWSTVVPTPTTSPAQNFVDVFSNQTIGGNKTFSSGNLIFGTGYGIQNWLLPLYGSYTFSVSGGTVTAVNNATGLVAFSGSDAAAVVNSVLNAMASTGGKLYFKNGIYNINSLTPETASGWSNYSYGIGIPSNAYGSWVQFHFEGESRPAWTVDSSNQASIQNNGVIFNVTPTALSGLSGSNIAVALWQRPSASNPPNDFSNEDFFKNIEARFPSNTQGNEIGFGMYTAMTLDYENVAATFNMTAAQLAAALPTAGSAGSYGVTSSYSSSGNVQHFKNVYSAGFQYGYDIQGEHLVADTVTSAYCTTAGIIGRSGTAIYHPIVMTHVIDQENQNGWVLGNQIQTGTPINMAGLDIEIWTTGPFARVHNLFETNNGTSNGVITYASVQANVGAIAITPFSNGGGNFLVSNGNGWGTCGLAYGAHSLATYTAVCPCPGVNPIISEGRHYSISDSNTITWGATVAGGGTNHVEGYCDGTQITVEAK